MSPINMILQQVDLFRSLTEDQLNAIATIITEETFDQGQVIFNQGDQADKMYIISSGQVEVSVRHSNGKTASLVYLGMGQVIGEMALVDEGRRSASVVAAENATSAYVIPNQSFTDLCKVNTAIGYVIMRNIAQDMSFKLRHRDYEYPGDEHPKGA